LSTGLRSIATAGLLATLAFALYAVRIGHAPLTPAELDVTRLANSDSTLFFKADDERWLQPLAVYATSLMSAVVGTDHAGRLAAAAIGGLNVALMFLLVRALLSSTTAGIGAALLLMATPAHAIFARMGVDAIYPLPFVLTWLISLNAFLEGGDRRFAAVGALALGVGVYSTQSAPLTMGFLLIPTLGAIWLSGRRDLVSYAMPAVAFAAPLGVAAIWFVMNPAAYPDTFGRWAIHAAHLGAPLDLAQALVNWNTLGTRASLYWGFFDPAWLFLDDPAASSPVLGALAPFLFGTAIALVAGLWSFTRSKLTPMAFVLLAGLAVAPVAASTFNARHVMADALVMVPLIVIIAVSGMAVWLRRSGGWQWLGYGVTALIAAEALWLLAG
jgi:hypothetical protein